MENDPFYLFFKKKASLGILSVDGDFEKIVPKEISKVNNFRKEIE